MHGPMGSERTSRPFHHDPGPPGLVSETAIEKRLAPDLFEKCLAVAAIILFALVSTALVRGAGEWSRFPTVVWLHLATVMTPLALTPVQLLRRRGDTAHRFIGRIWAASLLATALLSFGIRDLNPGGLSFIHIFSAVTVVTVPMLVLAARDHRIARHRSAVRGLVTGALLTAGYFTLIPGRMPGEWLWG